MRYARAFLDEKENELVYRIFLTDALRSLAGFNSRYVDFIDLGEREKETRSPEEIIASISDKISNLGGEY